MDPEGSEGIESSSFDAQFANRKKIEIPDQDHKVEVVDITPPVLKDTTPVLLIPGWSENPSTYKKSLEEAYIGHLVKRNIEDPITHEITQTEAYEGQRRAIFLGFDQAKFQANGPEKYPQKYLREAEQILSVLSLNGIGETDAIFHSTGAISGLLAAIQRPDLFRNIVIDKPAAFIEEISKRRHLGRFLKLAAQELLPRAKRPLSDTNNGLFIAGRTLRYVATNPVDILSTLKAITTTDIIDLIHGLEDKGVMVSVISGINDPLFPTGEMVEHLKKSQGKIGKSLPIEGWYTVIGGHNELSLNESKHTRLALNALENMQRRREEGKRAHSSPVL